MPTGVSVAVGPKVDLVYLALHLFLVARIGFRAVSRVLSLLAEPLGIKKVPCPQTLRDSKIIKYPVEMESRRCPQTTFPGVAAV